MSKIIYPEPFEDEPFNEEESDILEEFKSPDINGIENIPCPEEEWEDEDEE